MLFGALMLVWVIAGCHLSDKEGFKPTDQTLLDRARLKFTHFGWKPVGAFSPCCMRLISLCLGTGWTHGTKLVPHLGLTSVSL